MMSILPFQKLFPLSLSSCLTNRKVLTVSDESTATWCCRNKENCTEMREKSDFFLLFSNREWNRKWIVLQSAWWWNSSSSHSEAGLFCDVTESGGCFCRSLRVLHSDTCSLFSSETAWCVCAALVGKQTSDTCRSSSALWLNMRFNCWIRIHDLWTESATDAVNIKSNWSSFTLKPFLSCFRLVLHPSDDT